AARPWRARATAVVSPAIPPPITAIFGPMLRPPASMIGPRFPGIVGTKRYGVVTVTALGGLFCHPGVLRPRLKRGEHDDPTAVRPRERRGHAALRPRHGRRRQRSTGCPAGSRADPARPGSGARGG